MENLQNDLQPKPLTGGGGMGCYCRNATLPIGNGPPGEPPVLQALNLTRHTPGPASNWLTGSMAVPNGKALNENVLRYEVLCMTKTLTMITR